MFYAIIFKVLCRYVKWEISGILITWALMIITSFYCKLGFTTLAHWAFHFLFHALSVILRAGLALAVTYTLLKLISRAYSLVLHPHESVNSKSTFAFAHHSFPQISSRQFYSWNQLHQLVQQTLSAMDTCSDLTLWNSCFPYKYVLFINIVS